MSEVIINQPTAIAQGFMANQQQTMSSREIADLVEKRHDNVMRTIETLFERGVITLPHFEEVPNDGPGPLLLKQYQVGKRDSYIIVAQLSPEFTARLVDRWQELEARAIPKTLSGALRLAADQAEQIERLAIERDKAIATKAQIGSKREATAMATASAAKREASRLRDELGFSAHHATILQVEDATGRDLDWLPLRRWCKANEIIPAIVPDKRYPKGVKAWPAQAWMEIYGVDLKQLFGRGM